MKNQYIGDSKDYGKYRILTTFVDTTGLRLGVNWYRNPDDDSSQGRTRLKHCTDPLYKQMIQFVATKRLSLEDIENSGLLPNGTEYFNSELSYCPELDNMIARHIWHGHALVATKNADVVFLDPDNGLPPKKYTGTDKSKNRIFTDDGYKYVRFEEIQAYWERGQSLIVFQHAQNNGISKRLDNLNNRYCDAAQKGEDFVRPHRMVKFQRKGEISPINELAFLFYLQPDHLDKFLNVFLPVLTDPNTPWQPYFALPDSNRMEG